MTNLEIDDSPAWVLLTTRMRALASENPSTEVEWVLVKAADLICELETRLGGEHQHTR